MRYLLILIVLLFSCEPTRTRVQAKFPSKRIIKDVKALSESFSKYDLEDALVLLDSILENSPGDHEAYWSKLGILIRLNKTDVAMNIIDSAIKKEPHLPGNYFFKGMIYDVYRDDSNAIKSYKNDIVLYDAALDTMKKESMEYKTAVYNRAVDQIYSGNDEGNKTLESLSKSETDENIKVLISLFLTMHREDLIHRNGAGIRDFLGPQVMYL